MQTQPVFHTFYGQFSGNTPQDEENAPDLLLITPVLVGALEQGPGRARPHG